MSAQEKFNRMLLAIVEDEIAFEDAIESMFAPVVDDRQLGFDLFDYEAEADDYAEYMADVEFFRGGC